MSRPSNPVPPGAQKALRALLRAPRSRTWLYTVANKSHGVTLPQVLDWLERSCSRGTIRTIHDGRLRRYVAVRPDEVYINGHLVALPAWLVPGKLPPYKSKRVHRMAGGYEDYEDYEDKGKATEPTPTPPPPPPRPLAVQKPQQKTDKYANHPLPARCRQRHRPAPADRSQQPA